MAEFLSRYSCLNKKFLSIRHYEQIAALYSWDVREISMPPNDINIEVYNKMVSGLENVTDVHHKIVDFNNLQ